MKLYSAPGFTSLADHIAMLEAGIQFDVVKVDIETKQIEGGWPLYRYQSEGLCARSRVRRR
jgi:glutathione S-transferase